MLGFETLTLAPIDRTLIDPSLLDDDEIAWLNRYHAQVRETLTPLVDPATAHWLAEATQPIGSAPLSPRYSVPPSSREAGEGPSDGLHSPSAFRRACCAASQLRPSKKWLGRRVAGSTPSRQRALTLILSGSDRGT